MAKDVGSAVFDDEMLTIEELAAYLKLKPQTIYKWAQTGKVPGGKFGKEWRFRRSTIERWIDSQIPTLPASDDEPGGDGLATQSTKRSTKRTSKKPKSATSDEAGETEAGGPSRN